MVGKITRIMLKYDIPQVVCFFFFAITIKTFLHFQQVSLRKISYILFDYHLILGRGVCLGNVLFNPI